MDDANKVAAARMLVQALLLVATAYAAMRHMVLPDVAAGRKARAASGGGIAPVHTSLYLNLTVLLYVSLWILMFMAWGEVDEATHDQFAVAAWGAVMLLSVYLCGRQARSITRRVLVDSLMGVRGLGELPAVAWRLAGCYTTVSLLVFIPAIMLNDFDEPVLLMWVLLTFFGVLSLSAMANIRFIMEERTDPESLGGNLWIALIALAAVSTFMGPLLGIVVFLLTLGHRDHVHDLIMLRSLRLPGGAGLPFAEEAMLAGQRSDSPGVSDKSS